MRGCDLAPWRDKLFAEIVGRQLLLEGGREGIGERENALVGLICDYCYYTLWSPLAQLPAELDSP